MKDANVERRGVLMDAVRTIASACQGLNIDRARFAGFGLVLMNFRSVPEIVWRDYIASREREAGRSCVWVTCDDHAALALAFIPAGDTGGAAVIAWRYGKVHRIDELRF